MYNNQYENNEDIARIVKSIETEGDAKGVDRRPDLRMDWGVNSANPEEATDMAKVLAFCGKEWMKLDH